MDHVLMKDIDGKTVVLRSSDLTDYFMSNFSTLFGMSRDTIAELRYEYLKLGGPTVMTPETVRATFLIRAVKPFFRVS